MKYLILIILALLCTGCEYILEPSTTPPPTCTGTYITGMVYGKLDTLGIMWKNNPPFCKYPENKWEPNPYVK